MSEERKHDYRVPLRRPHAEMEQEIERLRAFVRAFDAWRAGGLWPDADVSKMLRADLDAAREAVGPCS